MNIIATKNIVQQALSLEDLIGKNYSSFFTQDVSLSMTSKGLAKLGNIVAEAMFLVMFPGVAKMETICFGRKICVREAKMFLTPWQKHFLFPSSKICFRNTCFPSG